MYRQQIAKKNTPSLASTPKTQKTRPTPSYGSLSGMIQRATAKPETLRQEEWRQLDGAVGTRATNEIKSGKRTSWKPEFKGISAQLGEASTELTYSPVNARVSEIKDTRPQETFSVPIQAKEAETANKTGLPNRLKTSIENLSGYSLDNVLVHYNSEKPAQLQALAYTQGTDIHVGSGQEKYLAHEAWHVVQQMQGRVKPTIQEKGVQINDEEGLEREADEMGRKVMQTEPQVLRGGEKTKKPEKKIITHTTRNKDIGTQKAKGPKIQKKEVKTEITNNTQTLHYKILVNSKEVDRDEEVGRQMSAKLHPTKPQQGSATTGTKDDLYDNLRDDVGDRKYIKGHLLNGHLGGLGVSENLFPITAKANKDHSNEVEEPLKNKVRELYGEIKGGDFDERSYVRYTVEAKPTNPYKFHEEGSSKLICNVRVHKIGGSKGPKEETSDDVGRFITDRVIKSEGGGKEKALEQIGWGKVGAGKRSGDAKVVYNKGKSGIDEYSGKPVVTIDGDKLHGGVKRQLLAEVVRYEMELNETDIEFEELKLKLKPKNKKQKLAHNNKK